MSDESFDKMYAELQPLTVPVQVQCEDLRCLAYRDKDGNWRGYYSQRLLAGFVRVIEYSFE